tara:strand:- start:115 stop:606 length:492 start_codon:yes stop_codon:yes gene_type:complete
MAVPLIPVAAAAVARYLAKNGIKKTVETYGKKAVQQAAKANRKVDDALNKMQGVGTNTPGRASKKAGIIVGKKRVKADRITQGIKAGSAAGVAGFAAGRTSNKTEESKPKAKAKDPRVDPKAFPTYKKKSKPAISFREAQRKAKRNKQKTFTWEGRRYNTTEA